MIRSQNVVIAGAYRGKQIARYTREPYIILGRNSTLQLDQSTVKSVKELGKDSCINVPDTAVRGYMGELVFGPTGLAAAMTARRDQVYKLEILFKDGKQSVIEVDESLYKYIMSYFS